MTSAMGSRASRYEESFVRGGMAAYSVLAGVFPPGLVQSPFSASGHADEFAARLVDPEFVKAPGGGDIDWSVATKITCPDKTVAKREFWHRLPDELFAAEWDLLLCSAGSLSAVICEAARQRCRTAIDAGSLDQITFSNH